MKKISLMKSKKYVKINLILMMMVMMMMIIIHNDNKKYHKVRDHGHYTKKFRRATHSICNFRYKTPREIPKVFHNRSTYD